ncbi:MAG: DEAD/DEAH box helicase [Verrucomicrobiota bacterium]|nr:DEAD/DEAH box helicase [Verrucomicrobiota bacterium]
MKPSNEPTMNFAQQRALLAYVKQFDPSTQKAGKLYIGSGILTAYEPQKDYIEGTFDNEDVQDDNFGKLELFDVELLFEKNGGVYEVYGSCSCEQAEFCPHMFALAQIALKKAQLQPTDLTVVFSTPSETVSVTPTIPAPVTSASATQINAPIAPAPVPAPISYAGLSPALQRDFLVKHLANLHGRKLEDSEKQFIHNLADIYARNRSYGNYGNHGFALMDLDVKILELRLPATLNAPMSYGMRTLTPTLSRVVPDNLEDFWKLMAVGLTWVGCKIPPFMGVITDYALIERITTHWRADERQKTVNSWKSRLQDIQVSRSDLDSLHQPNKGKYQWKEGQELRLRLDSKGMVVEIRFDPQDEFIPLNKKELAALQNTKLTDFGVIDPKQLAVIKLLHTVVESYGTWRPPTSLSYTSDHYALASEAVRQFAGTPQLVNQDGDEIQIAREPARWEIVPAPKGSPEPWSMRVVDGSGKPLRVQMELPGTPTLLLSGALAHPAPVPMGTHTQAYSAQFVPQEVLDDPSSLVRLHAVKCRLPDTLGARITTIALRPRLRCSIGKPIYGDNDTLNVVLDAVSDDGKTCYIYTARRWQLPINQPSPESELKYPQFDSANRAAELLVPFKLQEFNGNWSRPCSAKFSSEFPEWLSRMPKETEILLSPELAGFNAPAVRAFSEIILDETGVSDTDWFDVRVALRVEDTTLTKEEIDLLLKAKGRYVRLARHGWRRLVIDENEDDNKLAASLGITINAKDTSATKVRFHALHLASPDVAKHLSDAARERIQQRAQELQAVERPPIPVGLKATLRPYQLDGFHFLVFLSENHFGGILADDMGLGKTVQALAWIAWMNKTPARKGPRPEKTAQQRFLVVCPKSVTYNWEREAARFTPGLDVAVFSKDTEDTEEFLKHTLVIVNYAMLRNRSDFFLGCHWTAVILDEGQNIKNPSSLTAQTASQLDAENRFILTGTPIENRLMDLWSLFAFAQPGLLGGMAAFKKQYSTKEEGSETAMRRLRQRVRHFMLRRTKGQVATDLPERIEEDVFCDIDGQQRKLYDAELKRARQMLLGIKSSKEFNQSRFNILQSLLRLRQICCDPRLIAPDAENLNSAKHDALFEQLEELREEGHKVLVFSQFTSMLDLIQQELNKREWAHLILTGATENRQVLVDKFQASPDPLVFLISLKAGGSGLNLTAASYVILYDPWWNPAVEAQAIDRTHRIGQTSTVIAYRLIARDTVEEKIRAMQKRKASLAGAIVEEETLNEVLDLDDLRTVLGLDPEA